MSVDSREYEGQQIIFGAGSRRSVAPAIRGLRICYDPGPAEHEMLRFDALHASKSKSRLLQEHDLRESAEHAARATCVFARSYCGDR